MSSVFKKQIVAVTGLLMVGFILGHLAGNLLIFAGPGPFNHYAETLQNLGELLWLARIVLIIAFVVHIVTTILIIRENRAARPDRYKKRGSKADSTFTTRTMIFTGLLVFVFLFIHIWDFTLPVKEGPGTLIPGLDRDDLHLYGLVWNSFLQPLRALFYIVTMCCLGMHLSHGIQSLFQTLGFSHEIYTPRVKKISVCMGIVVAIGFSLIPIYINLVRVPWL